VSVMIAASTFLSLTTLNPATGKRQTKNQSKHKNTGRKTNPLHFPWSSSDTVALASHQFQLPAAQDDYNECKNGKPPNLYGSLCRW
jgi:hypothetical protein